MLLKPTVCRRKQLAVWGVESNFGDISGKYPLLQALGTLSCEGRRQSYFRTEFLPLCVFYNVVI